MSSDTATAGLLFEERQSFLRCQFWAILVPLGITLFFGFACYRQLVLGQSVGNKPMGDLGLLLVTLGMLGMTLFMALLRLDVQLTRQGLRYRFYPIELRWRELAWSAVREAYVRRYDPIGEYGGWGIRGFMGKGRAYSVAGNNGLQLQLTNGKALLLGTQRPEEMAQALGKAI